MVVRTFASAPSTLDYHAIGVNLGNVNVSLPIADIHKPHYSETSVSLLAICLPVTRLLDGVANEAGLMASVLPLDATHVPFADRLALFALVAVPSALLTGFAIVKSKALSEFLEALSDERLSPRAKLATLTAVWRRPRRPDGG